MGFDTGFATTLFPPEKLDLDAVEPLPLSSRWAGNFAMVEFTRKMLRPAIDGVYPSQMRRENLAGFALLTVCVSWMGPAAGAEDLADSPAAISAKDEGKSVGATVEKSSDSSPVLRYKENTLTVHCEATSVRSLLEELREQSGAEIEMDLLEDSRVTVDFERLPLQQALKRLMPNQNYFATYRVVRQDGADGVGVGSEIARLEITGPAGDPMSPPASAARRAEDDLSLEDRQVEASMELYGSLLTVPLQLPRESGLATALGRDTPSVKDVLQAAFRHGDEPVRREAAEALARTLEPRAAEIALPGGSGSIAQMAEVLREVAGPNAEEFIAVLAENFQTPRLRTQALAIGEALKN